MGLNPLNLDHQPHTDPTALPPVPPGNTLNAPGSPVCRLTDNERPDILAHLLTLNPDDRYERFGAALKDPLIATYVNRIDFTRDIALGLYTPPQPPTGLNRPQIHLSPPTLHAFLHLAIQPPHSEIGASVHPAHRLQGQATLLFHTAIHHARQRGVQHINLIFGHPAAIRILQKLGCTLRLQTGVPRASFLI